MTYDPFHDTIYRAVTTPQIEEAADKARFTYRQATIRTAREHFKRMKEEQAKATVAMAAALDSALQDELVARNNRILRGEECIGRPGACIACKRTHIYEVIEEPDYPTDDCQRLVTYRDLGLPSPMLPPTLKTNLYQAGPYQITEYDDGHSTVAEVAYRDPAGHVSNTFHFKVK